MISFPIGLSSVMASALLFGSCTPIRQAIIDTKDDAVMKQYQSLDDCGRVEMARRYLERGQIYDSFLDAYLPSDDVILNMVCDLGQRTGISRDVGISHWRLFFANRQLWAPTDPWWFPFIEPWSIVLGCTDRTVERSSLLRTCDPKIAAIVDAVLRSPLVDSEAGPRRRVHFEEFNVFAWTDFLAELDSTLSASGFGRATGECPSTMGDWRITCDGVLPRDGEPELYVYFGRIAQDRYVVKLLTKASIDAGPVLRDDVLQTMADDPQFTRLGRVLVYEIHSDGPRVLFTATHQSTP